MKPLIYQKKNIISKLFLSMSLFFGTMTFAQDYYDTYPQDYYGDEYYDDSYSYPDNYYYNYPADYYPDQYYQGYYNDYRRAIFSVNWDQFFIQFRLSPYQINQIMMLNNRFASYAAWNNYYRWNPDRWYYDRFFALQNILGPRVFVVYQNTYFHGRSPIVFYQNRFNNFYARRYPVQPMYRNVNIVTYRVDRNNFRSSFRQDVRANNYPNNNTYRNNSAGTSPRSGSSGSFGTGRSVDVSGTRSGNDGSFRNYSGNSDRRTPYVAPDNTGFRNAGGMRQNTGFDRPVSDRSRNDAASSTSRSGGYRNSGSR